MALARRESARFMLGPAVEIRAEIDTAARAVLDQERTTKKRWKCDSCGGDPNTCRYCEVQQVAAPAAPPRDAPRDAVEILELLSARLRKFAMLKTMYGELHDPDEFRDRIGDAIQAIRRERQESAARLAGEKERADGNYASYERIRGKYSDAQERIDKALAAAHDDRKQWSIRDACKIIEQIERILRGDAVKGES